MRHTSRSSFFLGAIALAGVLSSIACGGTAEPRAAAATPEAAASVQLAPENVVTATLSELSSGPTISGQLTAARAATVRAQVGGSLVKLGIDRGQSVHEGDVIAKISSRDLDDGFESAQTAVKSAETTLAVATSERQRTENLVKGGALAARDLEQAKNVVSNAEAMLASAKARQKSVWQQLDDTNVRAPFSGIVSDRPANQGDIVSPGNPILTIIDPSSLRLEALVPSDQIGQVHAGAKVHITIRGFPGQTFIGSVERLGATADPVTRQVSIFVSLPNVGGKLIAGLFAEGRVDAETRKGIVVPLTAVDETGPIPMVTRVREGKAEHVSVELGLRQSQGELIEILKGVAAGDVLITGSAKGIAAGTPVRVVVPSGK